MQPGLQLKQERLFIYSVNRQNPHQHPNLSFMSLHRISSTFVIVLLLSGCTINVKTEDKNQLNLEGTWELLSATTIANNDTVVTDYTKNQRMIKIINATHFAFVKHDLNKGKDRIASFDAGAGRYTLKDNEYIEYLDYCNYREWEGQVFHFNMELVNDTLTQTGREKVEATGVDRIIIEKYKKASPEIH
jgi:hypothetical protein